MISIDKTLYNVYHESVLVLFTLFLLAVIVVANINVDIFFILSFIHHSSMHGGNSFLSQFLARRLHPEVCHDVIEVECSSLVLFGNEG